MRQVRVPAFAKINLTLKVLWRRPDGYHDIATVFQTIDLCDWLVIEVIDADSTSVEVSSSISIPGENIAKRAAEAVLAHYGRRAKVRIQIEKNIPLGGGLGGSSTDGSAVLLALPKILGLPWEPGTMEVIGARLGSDVNFFLHGGTAAAFGRGDQLELLPDFVECGGYLVTPGFPVDTAQAYRALGRGREAEGNGEREKFQKLLHKMRSAPLADWAADCVNDFEAVAFGQHPQLGVMLERLKGARPKLARMSGSGSSLFCLEPEFRPDLPGMPFRTLTREGFAASWRNAFASVS